MRFCLLLLAPLLFAPLLPAQKPRAKAPKPAAAPAPKPAVPAVMKLTAQKVKGNSRFTEAEILQLGGLQPGSMVTPKDIELARERLAAAGVFDFAGYEFATQNATPPICQVTFEVKESGPLYPVRFEELPLEDGTLHEKLKAALPLYRDQVPLNDALFARYVQAIEQAVQWPKEKPRIRAFFTPEAQETVILFRPNSSRATIADVEFEGNQALTTTELRTLMYTSVVGTIWSEPRFLQALDAALRPLYEQKGLVRVKFSVVEAVRILNNPELTGVKVRARIEEPAPYNFGEIKASRGDVSKLVQDLELRDAFDSRKEAALLKRLEQTANRYGYLNAKASVTRRIDDEAKKVHLEVSVDEGPEYRFGRLMIRGLDIQTEPHIRKLWSMKPGAPFDSSYPDFFLEQVKGELDNLGKTRAELQRDERERFVDVTLHFEPEPAARPKPRI